MDPRHESLLREAKRRTGDALRAATVYDEDDVNLVYARDDIDEATVRTRGVQLQQTLQGRCPLLGATAVDRCKAEIELYEDSVFIHWYEENLLVSFDPIVSQRLLGFINACTAAMDDE